MSLFKKLAADTAVYGFSTVVVRLINYLLVAYHTRVLDGAQYGIFTEFYGYITLLLVLLTYGMETGFFKFASRSGIHNNTTNGNSVFAASLVCLFVTSAVFLVLILFNAQGIAVLMGYPHNPEYVRQLAAVAAIDAFMCIPFAWLRLQRRAKTFAFIKLLNVLFYVGINVLFFTTLPEYFSRHTDSFLLQFLPASADVGYVFCANLLASIFTLILLLPIILKVKIKFPLSLVKQMLAYSLPLLAAGLPGVANDYVDRLLFKHLLPSDFAMQSLGIYGANAKLAVLMALFVQMFRYAAEPFFFANAVGVDRRRLFADVMKYFTAAAVFIFLVVALFLDEFALFMGKEFRVGTGIVPIMLYANLLLGIVFNLSIWYKLSGRTSLAVLITLAGLFVTITINVIFVPTYGYVAAAWAHLCSNLTMVVLSYMLGRRYFPVPYDLRRIGLYMGVGLAFYGIGCLAGRGVAVALALLVAYAAFVVRVEKIWLWRKLLSFTHRKEHR
jgi:O-antigen/teichoic acid export membrane protein